MNIGNKDNLTSTDQHILVSRLFELQAAATPDLIALQYGNKKVTYKELDEQAGSVAYSLLQKSANSPIIGISTTRNCDMIIGILGILKAGKAYLPLDHQHPAERNKQIIDEAGVSYIIAGESEHQYYNAIGLNALEITQASEPVIVPEKHEPALAYILYTSGSTGKPKGVAMGHKAAINLQYWQKANSRAGVGTRTLQFAPLGFDVSFQEIFCTLTTGGTLVLINDELRHDPYKLLEFLEQEQINRLFLPFVGLQYLTDAAEQSNRFPSALQEVMTAGEQLKITPQVVRFFSALPNCDLYNQYGPTETHIIMTSTKLEGAPETWEALPNIGKPIDNTAAYFLDEERNLVPDGVAGEMGVTGVCLAEGYLNRPDLTAEKFITWTHPDLGPMRLYLTGDLGKYLPDGNIEYLGRKDEQVKIRGYRIELGEIETALNHIDGIKQAVVTVRTDVAGQKYLAAYMVATSGELNITLLRDILAKQLPDYMMPTAFTWLPALNITANGKVDKKSLPEPGHKRPELAVPYAAPVSLTEQRIAAIWATLLQFDKVGINDIFFELGGNSLLALKTIATLKEQYNYQLPVTKIYQLLTVRKLAAFLDGADTKTTGGFSKHAQAGSDVAIIGMAGRFPGADTIDELWELLKEGKETTKFFTDAELDAYIPAKVKSNPAYVKARGIINNGDHFDASFFGINPKVAELMDPQQRIFLEIAYEALENTGYMPGLYKGTTGVFAGSGNNTYYLNNVQSNEELVENVGAFLVTTVNEKDYIATRTAFQLNLKGPAVSIHTACSTSLVAIAQAVESIRAGRCDIALAGGVSITSPINSGYQYYDGAMLSADGHCRPFDAKAGGTVFSDGAGVVLLKSKEAAERDGDKIYGIIKGIGLNNDGADKGNFVAPSADGQAGAVAMAIADAGIAPTDISYVEAHGTATFIGDPIEIEGLKMGFGDDLPKNYCAIGSIKSNMGHLTAAAGVAGLIKVLLALQHKQLPASINFESLNPNIGLKDSPFYVNSKLNAWRSTGKRIAGVSSLGVGGTNAHVIIEEALQPYHVQQPGRPFQLVKWSAKSEASLTGYAAKLGDWLKQNPTADAADIAYTLHATRLEFAKRNFAVVSDHIGLTDALQKPGVTDATITNKNIAFIFPGQDSRYVNMCQELYLAEPVFKAAVDECAALFNNELGEDILSVIYPEGTDTTNKLNNTEYAQAAVFTISYALAKLWMSWGISPALVCGHSIGEMAAAQLAGIFSLPDAVKLVAARGKLMGQMRAGKMLAVRSGIDKLLPWLNSNVSVAAINGPNNCVLSGDAEAIDAIAKLLADNEIPSVPVQAKHAFHSPAMDEAAKAFEQIVRTVKLNKPVLPLVSTVTGKLLEDSDALDPAYWSGQISHTVQFAAAIQTILNNGEQILLEVGPNNVAASLATQNKADKQALILSSGNAPQRKQSVYIPLLTALGKLWQTGIEPDWNAFYQGKERQRIDLPTYAFDRKYCWVNPIITQQVAIAEPVVQIQNIPPPPPSMPQPISMHTVSVREALANRVVQLIEDASGIRIDNEAADSNFIEAGLDSLLLTQITLTLKRQFGLPITFRQLNDGLHSLNLLVNYLETNLPAAELSKYTGQQTAPQPQVAANGHSPLDAITHQLQELARQVAMMQQGNQPVPAISAPVQPQKTIRPADVSAEEMVELKKPFGATAKIERVAQGLTEAQQQWIDQFIKDYNQKTQGSKDYTQKNRRHMADPRVVSGFRPLTKELVYSIVVKKSKGSRLWDLDDNEYIDALNGFGSNLLGYQPDFLKAAVIDQVEKGYEIGPQHELSGEVCKMICDFTGFDRSALCNTGSEAVLGAMRIARTVTGRPIIVAFTGSYHGIVDEVIVRGTKSLKSFPAAPGIMPEAVQNMLILDYGTDESLQIIKERANDIAAVLVEPVQSRRPEFQPVGFLKELRKITEDAGTVLVFDEVITGFRMHPGGAQAIFGVKADIGTYGKVIGGGFSVGAIAGKKEMMDALDGGYWQYGDDSIPEAGVTYFAGTFVRHPLALAATKASLEYFKQQGPALQERLNATGTYLASRVNSICKRHGLPLFAAQFGSMWKLKFNEDIPYSELLFTLMRYKGIHILDGFPCFITDALTEEDVNTIIEKFNESVNELIAIGILPSKTVDPAYKIEDVPPVAGARLGRDPNGNPAWFIIDPQNASRYLKVEQQ